MKILSESFKNHSRIPSKYTCDADSSERGIIPPLKIEDIPEGTKSVAIVMDDPDAGAGIWDHWIVWNIIPEGNKVEVKEGIEPKGVKGKNSWGELSYGGPCPQDGEHRYIFKAYALDIILTISEGSRKEELLEAIRGSVLDEASITGLYSRK